jgi:hypothetical protein
MDLFTLPYYIPFSVFQVTLKNMSPKLKIRENFERIDNEKTSTKRALNDETLDLGKYN